MRSHESQENNQNKPKVPFLFIFSILWISFFCSFSVGSLVLVAYYSKNNSLKIVFGIEVLFFITEYVLLWILIFNQHEDKPKRFNFLIIALLFFFTILVTLSLICMVMLSQNLDNYYSMIALIQASLAILIMTLSIACCVLMNYKGVENQQGNSKQSLFNVQTCIQLGLINDENQRRRNRVDHILNMLQEQQHIVGGLYGDQNLPPDQMQEQNMIMMLLRQNNNQQQENQNRANSHQQRGSIGALLHPQNNHRVDSQNHLMSELNNEIQLQRNIQLQMDQMERQREINQQQSDNAKIADLIIKQSKANKKDKSVKDKISAKQKQTCPVCLNDINIDEQILLLRKCRHLFHKECFKKWMEQKKYICPVCRNSVA